MLYTYAVYLRFYYYKCFVYLARNPHTNRRSQNHMPIPSSSSNTHVTSFCCRPCLCRNSLLYAICYSNRRAHNMTDDDAAPLSACLASIVLWNSMCDVPLNYCIYAYAEIVDQTNIYKWKYLFYLGAIIRSKLVSWIVVVGAPRVAGSRQQRTSEMHFCG